MTEKRSSQVEQAWQKAMQRTDITSTIQEINDGVFIPVVDLETLQKSYLLLPSISEDEDEPVVMPIAREIWNATKEERNALIAIFSDEIWRSSEERRAAPLPTKYVYGSYMAKKRYTQDVFIESSADWEQSRQQRLERPVEQWDSLDIGFFRFQAMIAFGAAHGFAKNDTPGTFVARGIGTASNVTWGVIELVDRLCKQKDITDPEILTSIVERAYGPIILRLASIHIDVSAPIIHSLFKTDFHNELNEDFFYLTQDASGWKLGLNHERLFNQDLDPALFAILASQPNSITTWCPARYAQQGAKEVIREYFDWSIALTKNYLQQRLINPFKGWRDRISTTVYQQD